MISAFRRPAFSPRLWPWIVVPLVLAGAAYLGAHPSRTWLVAPVALLLGASLLRWPVLGPPALVVAALLVPIEVSTGTEVGLNMVTLLVPVVLAAWLLGMAIRRDVRLAPSRTNLPLALFLLASLLSLGIGIALWDPMVPRPDRFLLVQLAQWAIFAFSAGAYWLAGSLITSETALRRLAFLFIAIAGGMAVLLSLPFVRNLSLRLIGSVFTIVVIRPPFWVLLGGLAGGQLLFNHQLLRWQRWALVLVCAAVAAQAFFFQRDSVSMWVGVGATAGVLIWLRWPRWRWVIVITIIILGMTGVLQSNIWDFAGGDTEWEVSGDSRLVLVRLVLDEASRNPITGLGPAAYRPYTRIKPLPYGRAYWAVPNVSSHNNYVDLFAQGGLLGLGIFIWFSVGWGQQGLRLRKRVRSGFEAGYVNAMLAAGVASLLIMFLADWILPFVYNIGFGGFQASVLVWLFMGGLVALDNLRDQGAGDRSQT